MTLGHPRSIQQYADYLTSNAFSAEPAAHTGGSALAAGAIAYSDGTASSNGFGVEGAGFYEFDGVAWSRLGGGITAAQLSSTVAPSGGSLIGIEDAGNYYTGSTAEAAAAGGWCKFGG